MGMKNHTRRDWIQRMALANTGILLTPAFLSCIEGQKKEIQTILVVSGWQDVNIGDIAHTPGLLHILQTFLPNSKIILWKKSKSEKVKQLLKKNFPEVKIIYGEVDADKNVESAEVKSAFEKADIMIHGSGPYVVGKTNLEAWKKHSSKPYGIFGVTIDKIDENIKKLLSDAAFIFTRETDSLKVLKENGLQGEHIVFAPDATFYLNIKNEDGAKSFLDSHGLEDKKFICVIPRLRITPYHKFIPNLGWTKERIEEIEELNSRKKEVDHAKAREAMIAWIRETGNKVLICPEMTYQVGIMDELLIDPLPEDVKPFVVKHGYWMPDEAASVYARAHTILSFDCHSPIIAARNGTPMFYLRQPEDTIKGQMYYDLGFDDWVFEIEETTGLQITEQLREVWTNYDKAKEKVAVSMGKVQQIYVHGTSIIKNAVH